jgi:hypothetical protein
MKYARHHHLVVHIDNASVAPDQNIVETQVACVGRPYPQASNQLMR